MSVPATSKMIGFIPEKEPALVLQGGGSLGANEAGAYKAIYEALSKEDNAKPISHRRSTFDIVAGTSIGAINAAMLVSFKEWVVLDRLIGCRYSSISNAFGILITGVFAISLLTPAFIAS